MTPHTPLHAVPAILPALAGAVRSESFEALAQRRGQLLGHSAWARIDQAAVDAFARLTGDANAAHVSPESASNIVHGLLTLSLIAQMAYEVCPGVLGTRQVLNYGFDRIRFTGPVPCGALVRGRFVLAELERPRPDRWQAAYDVQIEVQNQEKPALVARWVTVGLLESPASPE